MLSFCLIFCNFGLVLLINVFYNQKSMCIKSYSSSGTSPIKNPSNSIKERIRRNTTDTTQIVTLLNLTKLDYSISPNLNLPWPNRTLHICMICISNQKKSSIKFRDAKYSWLYTVSIWVFFHEYSPGKGVSYLLKSSLPLPPAS